MSANEQTDNGARHKRRLRNYLLDAGLQLRYTAAIVLIAVLLTAGLGYMIYEATRDTSKIIDMTGMVDPISAAELQTEFANKDRTIIYGIAGFGLVLIVSVAAVGILITHKIAGPLYNIAAICNRVRDNRLGPPLRGLRKGDELQEFYGTVRDMHDAIRLRLDEDMKVLSRAIAHLESLSSRTPEMDETLSAMKDLRANKERSLAG